MKNLNLVVLFLLISILGCGKDASTPLAQLPTSEVSNLMEVSKDGSVHLYGRKYSDSEIERERKLYTGNDLVQVPVDPKYNVSLFMINNVSVYDNAIFLAPKIFVYAGEDKARLNKKINSDGSVTINLPIILVDGLSNDIPAADGRTKIQLPDTMLIKNESELRKELAERYHGDGKKVLSILPGCPKSVHIRYLNQEYDATPLQFKNGDYCQMNAPFTASLTLSGEEARELLQEGIYQNAVDVTVRFETRARISVAELEIKFDKQKVFQKLETSMSGKYSFAEAEVKVEITKVMQEEIMKVNVVGDVGEILPMVVSQTMERFFEKFRPDPNLESSSCGRSLVCLRLNYSSLSDTRTFSVKYNISKNELMGQNFISWAKLNPMDDSISIGGEGRNDLNFSDSFETGLTVSAGDLLEIQPNYLKVEKSLVEKSPVSRSNNNVCIKKERQCTNRWRFPGRSSACVEHDDVCVSWENQFVDMTTYGLAITPITETINNPMGQTSSLFEGLSLEFSWTDNNGNPQRKECPISQFSPEADGSKVLIRLENKGICEIFGENNRPLLHLRNKITFNETLDLGFHKVDWRGNVLERPKSQTVSQKASFSGNLRIRGYRIGSGKNFTSKI